MDEYVSPPTKKYPKLTGTFTGGPPRNYPAWKTNMAMKQIHHESRCILFNWKIRGIFQLVIVDVQTAFPHDFPRKVVF